MDADDQVAHMEQQDLEDKARHFLEELQMPDTVTNIEHMVVLLEAMQLYAERNNTYKDLWRVDGWMGLVHHIRHKSLRIHRLFSRHQDAEKMPKLDDAPDLINYTAMFIRMGREGVTKKYED